jgi:hypothetical protein
MQAREQTPHASAAALQPPGEGPSGGRRSPELRWPIAAVIAVLAVVTLTRLELFAVYENERDALRLLMQIAERLEGSPAAGTERSLAAVLQPDPKGLSPADLLRAAGDADWLEAGRVLRWHGYLFELEAAAGAPSSGRGPARILAWPWQHGHTGVAAYAFDPAMGLLGHPNRSPDSGPWSGLERRPDLAVGRGWKRLPAAGLP